MHFIDFFVVETKRFVGSFVHVILTRQTCGQRSSRAVENKRRVLENYSPERIRYMFHVSKCRGDCDVGLYTTSELAFGEPQRNGKIRFFLRRNTFFSGSRHCAAVLQTQVLKLCTDLHLSLLYILLLGTYSKFAQKNEFLALGVCFPQPCSSALAACLPRQDHVYKTTEESFRFHNQNFDKMRCKLDSTENPCSFKKYPTPP